MPLYPASPLGVAEGGTGLSSFTIGDVVYASGATTLAGLADVAVSQVLASGGVGVAPAWSATPTLTSLALANGTVGAPALTLNGATTGLYWDTAKSAVTVSVAGVARLYVDGSSMVVPTNADFAMGGGALTFASAAYVPPDFLFIRTGVATAEYRNAAGQTPTTQVTLGRIILTSAANTTPITASSYSLTGASAVSMVSYAGTLNTTGIPTVWDMNITQTASGAGTLLMQIRDGGTNYMSLSKAGLVTTVALSLTQSAATAPSTNAGTVVNRYGGDTNFCGDPTEWITITTVNGTRKIPAYA